MLLEPLGLDDLTWTNMVAAIRGRIVAASAGRWTLHAPVDPGMTLLELFAWLLEQRVYFIDQVPPSMQRGLLRLLGGAPRPEQAASTVLAFRGDPGAGYARVPAGTVMKQRRRGAPLLFTTDAEFTHIPVGEVGLLVGAEDRSLDLAHHRTLFLFPAAGPYEARILLWLPPYPSPAPPGMLSMLLELTPPGAIPPQWSVEAAKDVPPPAEIRFSYQSASGIEQAFAVVDDGTGGLRRSGVVRLALPPDWKAESTIADGKGNLPYAVRIGTLHPTFSTPPRLAAVTPNVAIARHTRPEQFRPVMPFAWAPVAGVPRIQLPADSTPPIVRSVKVRLRERYSGAWHEWSQVDDLAFFGPGDRVFLVDRARGVLTFGDGLTGRMPVLDETHGANIEVDYAVGGGRGGNVSSGAGWTGPGGVVAVNPVAAEGGSDSESLADAQKRVGIDQGKPTRAITAADFRALIEKTRVFDEDKPWGVAAKRAHAAVGFLAEYPCLTVPGAVTVFVVPDVPHDEPSDFSEAVDVSAPQPDPGTLAVARQRVEQARLVGSEVVVSGPIYTPVTIVVDVVADVREPVELRQRVSDRVRTYLHPLRGGTPSIPGADGDGWPFGAPIQPSALLEQVQLALGDDGEVTAVAIGIGDADPAPSCGEVAIGAHRLIDSRRVTVRLAPRATPPAGLR